jgi:NAD(P)H-flavin reductase
MPATPIRATLERVDILSYNVRAFRFKLAEPPTLAFQAGQFLIVNVPKGESVAKRAYSVASPPHEPGVIELCVQHAEGGVASTYFWGLKPGATVSLNGPHGRFVLKQPYDYEPVLMATGTGVAPFRAMIKDLLHQNFTKDVWLLFGTRYEHALLYESEFRTLANLRRNFHYIPTVSRPKEWRGETGHIQQTFQKVITDVSNKEIYVCGWLKIVKEICKDLESFGIAKEKLHYEEW